MNSAAARILQPPILASAVILALLTAPAAAATHARPVCVVPKVKGDTLAEAKAKLTKARCALGHISGAHAGLVIAQSPAAGRKVKGGTKVQVALKAKPVTQPTSTPAKISYSTAVDPSFTQSPTDPLAVTYSYSADATQTLGAQTLDLAQADELPAGILNFYNGGSLACSTNVGGTTSSGTCSITYPATGSYQVTTQYIPTGATAVTETDTETINPAPTSTFLAVAYGTPFSNTGPPPTYLESTDWFDGIDANYSEGSASSFTLTLTDETTGMTQVGASVQATGCAIEFVQVLYSSTIDINPGCGLPAISFADTDIVSVKATTSSSGGFLGSVSSSALLWDG